MQPNMINSSDPGDRTDLQDEFRYSAALRDYFTMDHRCTLNWTTNVSDSHTHNCCEIVIYLQELKCLFVNDTMYVSQKPCFFTFRPGEYHYAIHSKPSRHELYVMHLNQDRFFTLPGGRELLRCLFDREAGEHNMIILPEEDKQEAFRLLNSILSLQDSTLPERQLLQLTDMIRLLAILNRHYLCDSNQNSGETAELLRRILSYIGNNLTEPLRVADLARQFNISQSTLERIFRSSLTLSPREYIIRRRMDAARQFLRQGLSVTDACSHAGFGDYSHFIADFRRFMGITPAEYARRHRHEE